MNEYKGSAPKTLSHSAQVLVNNLRFCQLYRLKHRSFRRRTCFSVLILVIITYASFSSVHFLRRSWSKLIACRALTSAVSSISLSKFRFWAYSRSLRLIDSWKRVFRPASIPCWPFCSLYSFAICPIWLKTLARSPGIFSM